VGFSQQEGIAPKGKAQEATLALMRVLDKTPASSYSVSGQDSRHVLTAFGIPSFAQRIMHFHGAHSVIGVEVMISNLARGTSYPDLDSYVVFLSTSR
jgi:hypothetical protein